MLCVFFFSFAFCFCAKPRLFDRGGALHLWWMSCFGGRRQWEFYLIPLPARSLLLSSMPLFLGVYEWCCSITMWISAWWIRKNKRDLCFLVFDLFKGDFVLLPLQHTLYFFFIFLCGMLSEVLCTVWMLCFQTTLLRRKKENTVEISCHVFPGRCLSFQLQTLF